MEVGVLVGASPRRARSGSLRVPCQGTSSGFQHALMELASRIFMANMMMVVAAAVDC